MNQTYSTSTELIPVRVSKRQREASGIVSIILEAADGGPLPEFRPGAHIDVRLPDGLIRQYSLCSDPLDRQRYRIAVLLAAASRGGSRAAHSLLPGAPLMVGGPRNHFPLVDLAAEVVLIAGGIGITPILPMVHALHGSRIPFRLHYFSRSRAQTAFRAEIANAAYGPSVSFHYSDVDGMPTPDALRALIGEPASDRHLYVCGPRALMDLALDAAVSLGWSDDTLHSEQFSASSSMYQGAAVRIELARSGISVAVRGDQSLAQALIAAGVRVPLSCEQGICGTCVARVLAGTPDHRDRFLTAQEKARCDRIALCCSRALSSTLTLDL